MFALLSTYNNNKSVKIADVDANQIILSNGIQIRPAKWIWLLPDAEALVERSVATLNETQLTELAKHEQARWDEQEEVPMFTLNPNRLRNDIWNIDAIDTDKQTIHLVAKNDGGGVWITWMDFWCRIPEYQREKIIDRMTEPTLKTTFEGLRQKQQWRRNKPKEAFDFAEKLSHGETDILKEEPWLARVCEGNTQKMEQFVEILKERHRMKRDREYALDECDEVIVDVASLFPKKLHTLRHSTTTINY
jgi:hypothetical protein